MGSAWGDRRNRLGWRTLAAPLRAPGFRLFFVGNVISLIGDQFQMIALALLILDLPEGVAGLGAVLMVQAIPRLVFSIFGGVAIDRLQARTILIGSYWLQGAVVGVLVVLAASDSLALWHLYVYGVLSGGMLAFSYPASNAMIPELLPASEVRGANALSVSMFNLSRFLVPPLASWVIAVAGIALALGFNALSFLVAALCIGLIRRSPQVSSRLTGNGESRWWDEVKEGIDAARSDQVVWLAIVMSAIYSLGYYGTAFVALPALAKITLGAGEQGVGILYSALGAGALCGAVLTGGLDRVGRPGLLGGLVVAGNGIALSCAGLAPSVWSAVPALLISGICGAASAVVFFSLVQTRAAPHVRGRILSLYSLAIVGMYPVSFGLAGLLSDVLGTRVTIVAGGIVVLLGGLLGLGHRALREVELAES